MPTLSVTCQGATLRHHNHGLEVVEAGKTLARMAYDDVERVAIFGRAQLTTQAIHTLLEHSIPVLFLARNGCYRGQLEPAIGACAPMRILQFQRATTPAFTLATARSIVTGKIHNQIACLSKRRRSTPETASDTSVAKALIAMRAMARRAQQLETLDGLRGAEGQAQAAYFAGMRPFVGHGFTFPRRVRRPPTDPFNALLSLIYTLVSNEVSAAVAKTGLDPHVGFLHALAPGRPALVCDLVEEWRAPLADNLTLALINNGSVRVADFQIEKSGSVRLKPHVLRQVAATFERRMERTIREHHHNERVSWRRLLYLQALAMQRTIRESEPYTTYRYR